MPGSVLTISSSVQCAHLGKGTPVTPNPRIKVMGQAVVTIATQYSGFAAGCGLPAATGGNTPPCATGSFTTASTKVLSNTGFVLLSDSKGTTLPTGSPIAVIPEQTRVTAI